MELCAQHQLAWRDERCRELIQGVRDVGRFHTLWRTVVVQVQCVHEETHTSSSTEPEVLLHPGIEDIDILQTSEISARFEEYRGRRDADRLRNGSRPNLMGAVPGVETRGRPLRK